MLHPAVGPLIVGSMAAASTSASWAALRATVSLDGIECEVVGDPDFLIAKDTGCIIRDSKISRRITEKDHPEILRQVELYGWLYERTFRQPPLRLPPVILTLHLGTFYTAGGPDSAATPSSLPFSPPCPAIRWCNLTRSCWPRGSASPTAADVGTIDA